MNKNIKLQIKKKINRKRNYDIKVLEKEKGKR